MKHTIPTVPAPGVRFRAAGCVLAVWLVLAGCAGPRSTTPQPAFDSPEAALLAIASTAPSDRTYTATARIEVSHQGGRYPLRVAVMIRRPDLLRVESIPLFGPPDWFLSAANGELRVYLPGRNEYYAGPATPENISRFFPLSLPVPDILSLLTGSAPAGRGEGAERRLGQQEGAYYRIDEYGTDRMTRTLWIDPSGNRLVRIRQFADRDRTTQYEALFEEHGAVEGRPMPRKVTIGTEGQATLAIRYGEIRAVTDDPGAFPLARPEGAETIRLEP